MSPAERKRRYARQIVRSRRPASEKFLPKDNPASLDCSRNGGMGDPIIVRTAEGASQGVYPFDNPRYALGYILSGRKRIFTGDGFWEAFPGDVFFMSQGTHYVENIPSRGRRRFEQVVFYYTPELAARALANLAVNFDLNTCVDHTCDQCMRRDHVVATGWSTVSQFFESTAAQLGTGFFDNNSTSELLAFTMLVYHVVSQPEGCLRTRFLGSTDPEKELMERMIHEYVYKNISLVELARRSNRSLSSFKKKFRDHFGETPHRWVTERRLMHARLLLIQTARTTTDIARECHFGNCSHFIKLFRDEYGITPHQYRMQYKMDVTGGAEERQAVEEFVE